MFGHQDTNDQTTPQGGASATQTTGPLDAPAPASSAPAVEANEVDEALKALAAHASPDEDEPTPTPVSDSITAPAHTLVPAPEPDEPAAPARDASPVASDDDTNQLLDLKQSALQQLTPLIDKLDQTPEERFRTSMMMIQAADNQALLPTAYEAAQQIEDEKVKAQALLDIVNEINYFTQQGSSEA